MPTPKLVEVSQDVLGYLLVYARDWDGHREGEPLGEPDYYKTRAGAQRAAKLINDVPNPGPVQMSK